ncbi:TonB-dependent receptor domain-containing protein [Anaerospora sp.]|uniref:TonB-dependent receptor plug domain-containing protein n=1 Tax=Anaerospora sp. TaxID=1960278 RepID=UPI0028A141CB|nr:TonB-dependent receptor [Anaerospora sp.]
MGTKKSTYFTVLALLLTMPAVQAQAGTEEFDLPEVVVTATKTEMNVKDVPSAVQVITKEDIEARGARTLKDVLRFATGVNITRASNHPTREAVSIRGFGSEYSMILIDGKRIVSEIDQSYELDRISMENIERIEIVRGPVSSLYGTEALGGVVNIITKKSTKQSFTVSSDNGFLTGGHGEAGRYNFAYDSGVQGKTSFMISGSSIDNNAVYKSDGSTYSPFGNRKNINARVDYKLSEQESLSLTAGYSEEDTNEYVQKGLTKNHDFNDRNEQSISYNRKTGEGELFFRYYQAVMNKNLDVLNPLTNTLKVPSGPKISYVEAKRTLKAFEGRYTQTYGSKHTMTFGGEYRPEKFRGTAVATGEGTFTTSRGKSGSTATLNYLAAYAQDEWMMSPKVLMITSLRYDDSNKFESSLSPKMGITYKAADDLRFKFNAAKGFRSPTPNQLYQNNSDKQGNPNLKSETSNSFDLSVERDFGTTTTKFTVFTNKVSDMITLQPTGVSGEFKYQNINKATLQGVEAEIVRPIGDKLFWSNSYSYLEAVDDSAGIRLTNQPRHKITSRLSYNDKEGFSANLWADGYSGYLIDTGSRTSNQSFVLWNVALSKQIAPTSKIMLGVDNVFNKKDEDAALLGTYIHGGIQFTL